MSKHVRLLVVAFIVALLLGAVLTSVASAWGPYYPGPYYPYWGGYYPYWGGGYPYWGGYYCYTTCYWSPGWWGGGWWW
jgi:hypothetical protein